MNCILVGSYGLHQLCNNKSIFSPDADYINPNDYKNIREGALLQVCPQALEKFVNIILPTINVRFRLLTNNSDKTLPDDYPVEVKSILSNPYLIHWFSQNWIGNNEKVTRIPIGLDYHTLIPQPLKFTWLKNVEQVHLWGIKKNPLDQERDLLDIKLTSKPFWERELKCYSNYFSRRYTRYGSTDRVEANSIIPERLCSYQISYVYRNECWKNMIKCAFVVSPFGNGYDCHRTWEALILGCIPIVKRCGIEPVFDDLPVWVVDNWNEVTSENMKAKVEEFKDKTFNYQKLTLSYWKSKIINT